MNTLFVTYTLDNNTIDYPILSSKLKSFPDWIKLFNRAWIIKTSLSSKRVRDELDDIIGSRGRIVVINITDSPWATAQIDEEILLWMKRNIQEASRNKQPYYDVRIKCLFVNKLTK